MKIIIDAISVDELKKMADNIFGNMVKAVVDTDSEAIAIDGELHSDLEASLIESGSQQKNLWGINIYPDEFEDNFIEFDSMLNIKPSQGNKSRGVDDSMIKQKIIQIVKKRIKQ